MIAANADLQTVFTASADQIARLTRAANVSIDGNVDDAEGFRASRADRGSRSSGSARRPDRFCSGARKAAAREREKLQKEGAKLEAQLGNQDFVERAPAEKVEGLRARLADIAQRTAALDQMLEALS